MKIFGRYLHHDSWEEGGDCQKSYFEVFSRVGSDWPLCKISTLAVTPFMFFVHKCHIFDNKDIFLYLWAVFHLSQKASDGFNKIWAKSGPIVQCLRSVTTLSIVMVTMVYRRALGFSSLQRFCFGKVRYCFEAVSGFPTRQINQTMNIWWKYHSFVKSKFELNWSKWYLIKWLIECELFCKYGITKIW